MDLKMNERALMASLRPWPSIIVTPSFDDTTRRAESNVDKVVFSNEVPASELITWAPWLMHNLLKCVSFCLRNLGIKR
ncbi:MAG: hypothetical protein ACTS80_00680 [Candidatus Hodgkinia cicadicola]